MVFGASFVLLVLRRPAAILRAEFIIEDGGVFYIGTWFGTPLEVLFRPYAGYQHFIVRVFTFLERLVPVEFAPLVANVAALALLALLAAFVASSRLARAIPHAGLRLGLALLIVVLPNSQENVGVLADIQRYAPIYFLALAFATPPRGRWWTAIDLVVLATMSISGPYGLLLQPLFWWRLWRQRDRYSIAVVTILALGTMVQLLTLAVDGRRPGDLEHPLYVAASFAVRTTVGALLGQRTLIQVADAGIPLGVAAAATALVGAALAWSWRRWVPREAGIAMLFVWLAITGSSFLAQIEGVGLLHPTSANRYFLVPTAIVALVIVVAVVRSRGDPSRWVAFGLAGMLAIGIVGDLLLPVFPQQGWAERSACIGGPDPCEVPVWDPLVWTIQWPGADAHWEQPRPGA